MARIEVSVLLLAAIICVEGIELQFHEIGQLSSRFFESSSTKKDPRCKEDGIFAIPDDCTSYLVCKGDKSQVRPCPEGFRFDTIKHCTARDADCGKPQLRASLTRVVCPRDFGMFVYPGDCHKFIICVDGVPFEHKCPPGQVYQNFTGCIEGDVCSTVRASSRSSQTGPLIKQLRPDICFLPKDEGPCSVKEERYFYNTATNHCESFFWKGCYGNQNNFKSLRDCQVTCYPKPAFASSGPSFCKLPPETGPCKASVKKYYYDEESGSCKKFTYGGCQGNDNRFDNIDMCMRICKRGETMESICDLPPETGPCRGAFPHYYYDPASRRCKEFIYGGCDGNANRFKDQDTCERACLFREDKVSKDFEDTVPCPSDELSPYPGNCNNFFECSKGLRRVMSCPAGLHFSNSTHRCVTPCTAGCDPDISCLMDGIRCDLDTCFKCPEKDGKFSDLYDCSIYHECKDNVPQIRSCRAGKYFDHEKSKCVEEAKAMCVFSCAEADGLFLHPLDCERYIECKRWKPKVKRCPTHKAFDYSKRECVDIENTTCAKNDLMDIMYPTGEI